ncbi:MAG: hypothetical protein GY822_15365 [Deltaproteobacteria bacterium]|nr:hypothetical protein [Deltaproteobacteria bacterium]
MNDGEGSGRDPTRTLEQETSVAPTGEELRVWMSALLDGELAEKETELLYAAMETDEALLEEFEAFSASLCSQDAALSTLENEALTNAVLAATTPDALDDSSDALCRLASLAVDAELDSSAEPLDASSFSNDMFANEMGAQEVFSFLASQEAIHQVLNAPANAEEMQEAFAASSEAILAAVDADERFSILLQAVSDDLLSDAEQVELDACVAAAQGDFSDLVLHPVILEGIEAGLSAIAHHPAAALAGQRVLAQVELDVKVQNLAHLFMDNEATEEESDSFRELMFEFSDDQVEDYLQAGLLIDNHVDEAMHATFAAFAEYSEAKQAGDAALQAIAAELAITAKDAQQETAKQNRPDTQVVENDAQNNAAENGFMGTITKLFHQIFSSAATPALFAAGAALLFFVNQGPDQAPEPLRVDANYLGSVIQEPVGLGTPATKPDDELAAELAYLGSEVPLLSDNSAVEVQALEAGSATAMVFSTEATNITIIWVGELESSNTAPTE